MSITKSSLVLVLLLGCADAPPSTEPPPSDDGPDDVDAGADEGCGPWQVGTATGYNNSDLGDDPNAGSVMEFHSLSSTFYDSVPMAAIDFGDWERDKYRWIEVSFQGTTARVGVWDACKNEDCPDGNACCTDNKALFASPGYLVDLETRTAQRLFGVWDAESTLRDRIDLRVCGRFDPHAIAEQYGAEPW